MTTLFGVRRRDKMSDAPEVPDARTRRGLVTRVLAGLATGALLAGLAATPATAAPEEEPDLNAYSSGWLVERGDFTVNAQLPSGGGLLNVILGPVLNPILNGLVSPLVGTLTNLPTQLVAALLTGVFGTGLESSVSSGSAFVTNGECALSPAFGIPGVDCDLRGDAYYAAGIGELVSAAGGLASPILNLELDTVHGVTERLPSNGETVVAKSEVTGLELRLLSLIRVLDIGTIIARSECSPTKVSSSDPPPTLTDANVIGLVGGPSLISLSLAGDDLVAVSILDWVNIGAAGVDLDLGLGDGLGATARLDSNLLHVRIELSLEHLLSGLGLGVVSSLLSSVVETDIALLVTLGPGTFTPTDGQAATAAWGLGVGLGLEVNVGIRLPGLAAIKITTPPAVSGPDSLGNIADLRLAYTNCSTGAALLEQTEQHWISPGRT